MSSINPKKIKHRSPYNYMGIQFYDLKALMQGEENCQKEIDKQIRRLKRKKVDIQYSAPYLQKIIDQYVNKLKNKAARLHRNNLNTIYHVYGRRTADQNEYSGLLVSTEEQIQEKESEFEYVENVFKHNNPLYRGKLNLFHMHMGEKEEGEEEDE